jgi:hypothetical protein
MRLMKILIFAGVVVFIVAVGAEAVTAYFSIGGYPRVPDAGRLGFVAGVIDAINERAHAPSGIRWSAIAPCLNRFSTLAEATTWAASRAARHATAVRMAAVIIADACSTYSPRTAGNAQAYYNVGEWRGLSVNAQRGYVAGVADVVNHIAAIPIQDWEGQARCLNQFRSIGQASDWVDTYVVRAASAASDSVVSSISAYACKR